MCAAEENGSVLRWQSYCHKGEHQGSHLVVDENSELLWQYLFSGSILDKQNVYLPMSLYHLSRAYTLESCPYCFHLSVKYDEALSGK